MSAPDLRRGRLAARVPELMLALYALGLVALCVAPPSLRAADPQPSLLGEGARGVLADNATRFFYDDGFYYLVIARHLAAGAGPTFDGLAATSGYQPLWLLLLVPLAAAAPDAATLLVAALLLQAALLAVAAVVAYRTLRRGAGVVPAVLGVVLWLQFAFVYGVAVSGLEWGVHALLMVAVAWANHAPVRGVDSAPGRGMALLLALLFLARVDTLPLALCIGAWLLWRGCGLRRVALLLAPVLVATTTYAAATAYATGRPTPISAAVKREWSEEQIERDPRYREAGLVAAKLGQLVWPVAHQRRAFWLHLAAGTLGFGAALLVGGRQTRRSVERGPAAGQQPAGRQPRAFFELLAAGAHPRPGLGAWTPFVLFAALQWLVLALAYHDGYSYAPWYFTVQPWLAAVLVAWLARQTLEAAGAARRAAQALVAAAVLGVVAFTVTDVHAARARRRVLGEEPLYTVAREVRRRVPPGARVGAWNAGQIALLSGRPVVNLDGLVNSWRYFERDRHDPCRYFAAARIEYLADSFPPAGFAGMFPAPLACRGRLRLLWSAPTPGRLNALYRVELP